MTKQNLQIKFILKAAFLISLILAIATTVYASEYIEDRQACSIEDLSPIEKNHVASSSNNYGYLPTVLGSMMASVIICKNTEHPVKIICIGVGTVAGVADELINYFDVTDKHYITWGIFGIGTMRLLTKPFSSSNNHQALTHTTDVLGFAIGILIPTEMLGNHKEIFSPLISAMAGKSAFGTPGFIGGTMVGLVDEALLRHNITNEYYDKHYLTFCSIGITTASLLGYFDPSISVLIGTVAGTIAANYEETIVNDLLLPVEITNKLYDAYKEIIPEEFLNKHVEKQKLALVGGQFLTQIISLKLLEYQLNMMTLFPRLQHPTPAIFNMFQSQFVYFSICIIPLFLGEVVSQNINHYYSEKIYFELGNNMLIGLFSDETPLRLSYDKNSTIAMNNLNKDIGIVAYKGSDLITNAISISMNGGYGLAVIATTSPNMFIYSTVFREIFAKISIVLAKKKSYFEEKTAVFESELISIFENDVKNIRTIAERDGINITQSRMLAAFENLRDCQDNQRNWNIANSIWSTMAETINWVVEYALLVNEIKNNRVAFEQSFILQDANHKASKVISWSGDQAQNMVTLTQSLDRINVLKEKMLAQIENIDQIERVIVDTGNRLIIQNLEMGFGDEKLVSIDNLELEMGKIYAVTGKSGCGKTRFLYKIKGIKTDGSYAHGMIKYPKIMGREPKIIMVSQQDYFPRDFSLQEIIAYPECSPIDVAQQNEIRDLLIEAFNPGLRSQDDMPDIEKTNIGFLDLEAKEEWMSRLSGGEKKRILIISAIVKNPDVLILDESFGGLDKESTIVIQKMLKRMTNALILIVDHHAKDNNYDSFYYKELRFLNKTVFTREFSEKNNAEEAEGQ